MNDTNRIFLKALGLFFALYTAAMAVTGYWPGLRGFGVSERTFSLLMWLGFGGCTIAVLLSIFTPRKNESSL